LLGFPSRLKLGKLVRSLGQGRGQAPVSGCSEGLKIRIGEAFKKTGAGETVLSSKTLRRESVNSRPEWGHKRKSPVEHAIEKTIIKKRDKNLLGGVSLAGGNGAVEGGGFQG